jgi:hypothetical protein
MLSPITGYIVIDALSQSIGRVAFFNHLSENLDFRQSRNAASQVGGQDNLSILIDENCVSPGAAFFIHFRDHYATGDGFTNIDGTFEPKIHAGSQPSNLSPNFRDHAANQKSMADSGLESLCRNKPRVKMNGIVIARQIGESFDLRLGKSSGNRKGSAWSQSRYRALSNDGHQTFLSFYSVFHEAHNNNPI